MVSRERIYQSVLKNSTFGCRMYNWRHLIFTNRINLFGDSQYFRHRWFYHIITAIKRHECSRVNEDRYRFSEIFFASVYLRVSIGKNSCTDEILGSNYGCFSCARYFERNMNVNGSEYRMNVVALFLYRISPNSLEMLYAL